ncbi:sensor histidine kinase [Butyrivibrio sp. MC2013]|uniref:sensor histidine kinase n=1 Tax=Butyrivibrio sp. MC2013 TaxID=1280686 RepID=UPI0004087355|nr:histidine kinase [Butyrivibrio sp. MC2013]
MSDQNNKELHKDIFDEKQEEKKGSGELYKFIVILIIVFVVYVSYVTSTIYDNILESFEQNIESMAEVTTDNLDRTISLIRTATYNLSGSDSVDNWLKDQTYFSLGGKANLENQILLNKEMQNLLVSSSAWNLQLFDYITLYEDETLLATSYTKPTNLKMISDETSRVEGIISNTDDYSLMIPPTASNPRIFTTLRIQSDFTSDHSLYIIGATSEEYFRKSFEDAASYEGALTYIVGPGQKVYSSNDALMLGKKIPDEIMTSFESAGDGETVRVWYDGNSYTGLKKRVNADFSFVCLIPYSVLVFRTIGGMKSFFIVSVIVAVFSILMFIILSGRIRKLERSGYEARILLKDSEIRSLQHQMNPHFLFNILLTIQIKAKMAGNEAVTSMIASLSGLLRAGIYKDERTFITIREELKLVNYYLELQKVRYEDRLTYSIDIDDETIYDEMIPRLVIEPMVENAIVHGIENTEGEARVEVILRRQDEDVAIHVLDNGAGFDVDELSDSKKTAPGEESRDKTGISNTDQRIRLLCGEAYGINIRSNKGEGTDVMIKIPSKERKQSHDQDHSRR